MDFVCGKENKQPARSDCYLLWNGLGGYSSLSADFGAPRADQGLLVAALRAPNQRFTLVHRLQETLRLGQSQVFLSAQEFADGCPAEQCTDLQSFSMGHLPRWTYRVQDVTVTRQVAMNYGENTVAVVYQIRNSSSLACTLELTPYLKFAPKEEALEEIKSFRMEKNRISCDGHALYIHTSAALEKTPANWQTLAYPEDAKDGRPDRGLCGSCCRITAHAAPGTGMTVELVFSDRERTAPAVQILENWQQRMCQLANSCGFDDPIARQLAVSADAFIARRDSTGGKTILAGYPLFSDWGRDTMIALPGCCLATGRLSDARSILQTFLAYERDGLVPNLFPEGAQEPMYNTVDAALLLIDCVWQYLQCCQDPQFLHQAWPVMERIISAYRTGTRHHIGMDTDGLIYAGEGMDQVTWMDVRIGDILPTPRHGKPVEINAYWYNALKIMEHLAPQAGGDPTQYKVLAEQVKAAFCEKFYMADKGYLRDVISGTAADEQLRCNQIWAISMAFTMLPLQQEKQVLETVRAHLLTSCGLRTLSPGDPQYHGFYGGSQLHRDMAYHQGTVWVFPMGAYCRACLRILGKDARREVDRQLAGLVPMLSRGCGGQLPEIYDGDDPREGKGCFAQAWSVGEMLRVYHELKEYSL